MSDIVVFLGPSIDRYYAESLLDADYRPPAAQGDIFEAAKDGAKAILLIDGAFQSVPSVWHKEILWSLSRGVHVLGAASMGALRAAELDSFGMVGLGDIYAAYRDRILERDDEVAVVHAPAELGCTPLSLALVDIRSSLEAAVKVGIITEKSAKEILQEAARTYFADRTWEAILAKVPGSSAVMRDWTQNNTRSLKREDAVLALKHVHETSTWLLSHPFQPDFEFVSSVLWQHMVTRKSNPFLRHLAIS